MSSAQLFHTFFLSANHLFFQSRMHVFVITNIFDNEHICDLKPCNSRYALNYQHKYMFGKCGMMLVGFKCCQLNTVQEKRKTNESRQCYYYLPAAIRASLQEHDVFVLSFCQNLCRSHLQVSASTKKVRMSCTTHR